MWTPSTYAPSIIWLPRGSRWSCNCRAFTFPAWTRPSTTTFMVWTRFTATADRFMPQIRIRGDYCCAARRKSGICTRSTRKSSWALRKRIRYRHVVSWQNRWPRLNYTRSNWLPFPVFRRHFRSSACSYALIRLEPEELFQLVFLDLGIGGIATPARRLCGAAYNGHPGWLVPANWGCIWDLPEVRGQALDGTFPGAAPPASSSPVQLQRLQGVPTATGLARIEDRRSGLGVCVTS